MEIIAHMHRDNSLRDRFYMVSQVYKSPHKRRNIITTRRPCRPLAKSFKDAAFLPPRCDCHLTHHPRHRYLLCRGPGRVRSCRRHQYFFQQRRYVPPDAHTALSTEELDLKLQQDAATVCCCMASSASDCDTRCGSVGYVVLHSVITSTLLI